MRNLIVLSFVTLDGVMQAPGGPQEDISGGFKYGGWTVPYFDDSLGNVMDRQMGKDFDLLLGRKTYWRCRRELQKSRRGQDWVLRHVRAI